MQRPHISDLLVGFMNNELSKTQSKSLMNLLRIKQLNGPDKEGCLGEEDRIKIYNALKNLGHNGTR